jgi:hypothetical protein
MQNVIQTQYSFYTVRIVPYSVGEVRAFQIWSQIVLGLNINFATCLFVTLCKLLYCFWTTFFLCVKRIC